MTAPARPAFLSDLFNAEPIARIYDWLTDHPLWAEQNLGLLEHLDAGPTPCVLDLGAGTGVGTLALARALQGRGEVIGVEFSAPMVARARAAAARAALGNVRFVHADATALVDFADDAADVVLAHSFLYLVPDAQGVLEEARRVLRPRGRLVFMEPRQEASLRRAALSGGQRWKVVLRDPGDSLRMISALAAWRAMSRLEGRRTEVELVDLFRNAGFAEVRFAPTLGGLGHHVIAQ